MGKITKVKEDSVPVTLHTSDEVFKFKFKAPENLHEFLKGIFDNEYFIHISPCGQMSGILRTSAIRMVTIGEET